MRIDKLAIFIVSLHLLLAACANKIPMRSKSLPAWSELPWVAEDYSLLPNPVFVQRKNSGMQQYLQEVRDNNLDLKSIAATVRATEYGVGIIKAEARPQVDLNLSRIRGNDAVTHDISSIAAASLNVSWVMDIWGKLSDEAREARYSSIKANHDLQQAKKVLIGQATHAWIEYWMLLHAEKYTEELLHVYSQLYSHQQDAYKAGLAPYEFYHNAKNQRKRSKSRLQEVQLEEIKIRQYMNILRGRAPSAELIINDSTVPLELVALTETISAGSLANRPDIQAAFAGVQALDYSARAAHKALLPQINLTGSGVKSGRTLSKAFDGDLVWQLIGGLTQPLIHGGQLKAIAKQKSVEAEAGWWQYQHLVLQAMLEVENAMAIDKSLAMQFKQAQISVNDYMLKALSAEERFLESGLPFEDYLQNKAEYIEEKIELNEIEHLYVKNRNILVMALGLSLNIYQEESYEKL